MPTRSTSSHRTRSATSNCDVCIAAIYTADRTALPTPARRSMLRAMISAVEGILSETRDEPFVFVGDRLWLDFVNTDDVHRGDGTTRVDVLRDFDWFVAWLRAA